MARVHGRHTRVWVDGFDLTGDATNLQVSHNTDESEVHAFGDDRKFYYPGQEDANATLQGLFDSDSGTAAHAVHRGREGSSVIFSALYGTAEFSYGWGGTANPMKSQSISSPLAGAVTVGAEYSGPLHPMQSLIPDGANGGAGNNLDGGAGSNNGAVGVLQCENVVTGGTIKIEHSTTGAFSGEESDLINFGSIAAAARTAIYAEASGTVRQYVRANLAGSATCVVQFRRL